MSSRGYEVVEVRTVSRFQLVDVTDKVESIVARSGVDQGIAVVYSPHTTAGVTINEGADPDVRADISDFLGDLVPQRWGFKHAEGNSDAHVKTSFVGPSQSVIIDSGSLVLGTWQRIFLCEFDGPRRRRLFIKTLLG